MLNAFDPNVWLQVPGLMLMAYMAFYSKAPWALWIWVPLITVIAAGTAIAIEVRLTIGYAQRFIDLGFSGFGDGN